MNLLYPKFPARRLPTMARIAVLGSLVAGIYGALHDQVSYAISPEYFTKLKFHQFHYADFGWPPQVFAAEVGFLASWGVGLVAGWFLARAGLAEIPVEHRRAAIVRAFAIVFVVALLSGVVGLLLGWAKTRYGDLAGWNDWRVELGLTDLPNFVVVAYLHSASYLGALLGLIVAIWRVRKNLCDAPLAAGN